MKWESTFELNIEEFDYHHKHLVGLMNSLHADFIRGAGNATLAAVISELADYTKYHFSAEEHWMQEHHYPGLLQHRNKHLTFIDTINTFQHDFNTGNAEVTLELLVFLMRWLVEHILVTDASLGNFARGFQKNLID